MQSDDWPKANLCSPYQVVKQGTSDKLVNKSIEEERDMLSDDLLKANLCSHYQVVKQGTSHKLVK